MDGCVLRLICFVSSWNYIDGTTVYDALEKGLDDLMDLCDVVTDKFTEARDRFTPVQTV